MDQVKVENESLVRDTGTNAVLETDVKKLNRYRATKAAMVEKDKTLQQLVDRINNLEKLINGMAK